MATSKLSDRALITVFVFVICAVLPFDYLSYKLGKELPGRSPHKPQDLSLTKANIFEGKLGKRIEREMMRLSTFVRGSAGPYNEIVYRVSARTPPSIRLGRNGWLFAPRRHEENTQEEFEQRINTNVKFLLRIKEKLEKKNTTLVMAFVPDRSTMYPEHLYLDGEIPPRKRAFLPHLVKTLNDKGLKSYNLTEPLLDLKRKGVRITVPDDHHWNGRAAEAAATFLAKKLERHFRGRKLRKPPYKVKWENRASKATLLNKLGFSPGSKLEETFHVVDSFPVFKKRSKRKKHTPVAAYWSTSFGQYGPGEFFANAARRHIDIIRKNGRTSSYAIEAGGLERVVSNSKSTRKYIVVWEIPEYHTKFRKGGPPEYIRNTNAFLKNPKEYMRKLRAKRSKASRKGKKKKQEKK